MIITFPWPGDAEETELYLNDKDYGLRAFLRRYYEYTQEGDAPKRKFIVIGHSWGSVLSYLSLCYESIGENPIEPDLFITLGSPLGTPYARPSDLNNEEKIISGYVDSWFLRLGFSNAKYSPNAGLTAATKM